MKFDPNNKTNRFAQRTLAAFSSSLMKLLEIKQFEKSPSMKYAKPAATRELHFATHHPIPFRLAAEHYSNTIQLVSEWSSIPRKALNNACVIF